MAHVWMENVLAVDCAQTQSSCGPGVSGSIKGTEICHCYRSGRLMVGGHQGLADQIITVQVSPLSASSQHMQQIFLKWEGQTTSAFLP